jgi:hypothetical protein
MTDTSKRTARKTSSPTPGEQALDPEAFLVNSQDHMDAFLKANETIMQSMAALNAEVMAFGNKRLSESFERSESLADCDGAEEAFRVHCAFFQTAAQQYLEQTSTVLSLMTKMTEEFWSPLGAKKEEPSRRARPKGS